MYRRKASAIADAVRAAFPSSDISVTMNETKPRSKSFELTLKTGANDVLVWSGIKRGPPRKLKFPEAPDIVAAISEHIQA